MYSVSRLETTIFRQIILFVRVNFRSTFLSFYLTPYFDWQYYWWQYMSSIVPYKSFQMRIQWGAEKNASEIYPNFRGNYHLETCNTVFSLILLNLVVTVRLTIQTKFMLVFTVQAMKINHNDFMSNILIEIVKLKINIWIYRLCSTLGFA